MLLKEGNPAERGCFPQVGQHSLNWLVERLPAEPDATVWPFDPWTTPPTHRHYRHPTIHSSPVNPVSKGEERRNWRPPRSHICGQTPTFCVSCIINQLSRGVFRTGNLCHPIAPPQELPVLQWDSRKTHINIKCNGDPFLRLLLLLSIWARASWNQSSSLCHICFHCLVLRSFMNVSCYNKALRGRTTCLNYTRNATGNAQLKTNHPSSRPTGLAAAFYWLCEVSSGPGRIRCWFSMQADSTWLLGQASEQHADHRTRYARNQGLCPV